MNQQHEGIQGGFNRPEFSPGAIPAGPRVIPEGETTRADVAARDEERRQEGMAANRRRRGRLFTAIGAAVVIIALIVWAMVWFWTDERWAQAATMV